MLCMAQFMFIKVAFGVSQPPRVDPDFEHERAAAIQTGKEDLDLEGCEIATNLKDNLPVCIS